MGDIDRGEIKQARVPLTAVGTLVVACGFASVATAGTTVYKCVVNGQTTLTDRPCPGDVTASPAPATVVPSSQNPTPVGRWSGQLQFEETANGRTVETAHSVVLVGVEMTLDGNISGSSAENGCQLLGIWSQSMGTLISLDLTLSGCRVRDLDRRYLGFFTLARPDSSGLLQVQSIPAALSSDTGKLFDLKGTLRRQLP